MAELFLDAALLAIPNYATSKTEAETIIKRAGMILDWIDGPIRMPLVAPGELDSILGGLYPLLHEIETFLELVDLQHVYSPKDVYFLYQSILQRASPAPDDELGEPRLVDRLEITPSLPTNLLPSELRSVTTNALTIGGFRKHRGRFSAVISPYASVMPNYIEVKAGAGEVIERNVIKTLVPSVTFSESVHFIADPEILVSIASAYEMWASATSSSEIVHAIACGGLYELRQSMGVDVDQVRKFAVGSEFFHSLRSNQCDGNARFSRTTADLCFRIVAGLLDSQINPFVSVGRRNFDRAEAFRVHITTGNPALRLMVWQDDSGLVEFANVGPKKELRIERGSEASRVVFPVIE